MRLAQWLKDQDVSVPAFQERIGVRSRNTVYRYLRGEQVPEPKVMRRIIAATAGAVTANDFYDEAAA